MLISIYKYYKYLITEYSLFNSIELHLNINVPVHHDCHRAKCFSMLQNKTFLSE